MKKEITQAQVTDAVKYLKNGSAPGPNGYTSEIVKHIYKLTPHLFYKAVAKEIGDISQEEMETIQIKTRTMVFIQKPNNKKDIKKLRPLSLVSIFYKIIANIYTTQLRGTLIKQEIMPEEMTAFLPRRSGNEAVRKILDIKENADATNQDLFILSADIAAAFNSIDRNYILDITERIKFPTKFQAGLSTSKLT